MHPLDAATSLEHADANAIRGATSDAYWNFTGPFGGVTAATLLRAAMGHPERQNAPLSFTINYCAPVAKGAFDIAVRIMRTNRSTQHMSVEMAQGGEMVATMSTVFAARPATFSHQPASPPIVRAPEEIKPLDMRAPLAWLSRYEFLFDGGAPKFRTKPDDPLGSARSLLWLRDAPQRPLDFVSLAAMSDAFFARPFHVLGALVPVGTVSMTTYFHADEAELAAVGDDYVLGVADAHSFEKGFSDQTAELWTRGGRLLATSYQILYFRDKR